MPSITIPLRPHLSELIRLADAVERFGADHHVAAEAMTTVHLVLDELVSNVIKYGHADKSEVGIDVSLALDGARLTVDLSDDGIAFNPLAAKRPNLDLPIGERPIGGLGIHIVKALTDTITYSRENGRNRLTLTMRVER